ncbi:hypothetical protein [Litchfieldia salsa]|uniref:XRE family transcriptional regulator n=1 Tax=Litchfieldia salsa TaxID=930152 RepID=A0A1H0T9K4_9BACI|nr:hypothetical protein [Litchfieldia salsa]SDP50278.1 hypothetical protein SAMN05216565_103343 [Litchfieldia salsa]
MIDQKILDEIQEYINLHLNIVELEEIKYTESLERYVLEDIRFQNELEEFINTNRQPTLKELLFSFIDQKGATDPEIYKKAGIDRKHFSKIRTSENYSPRKNTVISLALALELNQTETELLLSSAGYSLSESDTTDLVIKFCIDKGIYGLQDINEALEYFSLQPLGNVL